jgi:hypothetical protein
VNDLHRNTKNRALNSLDLDVNRGSEGIVENDNVIVAIDDDWAHHSGVLDYTLSFHIAADLIDVNSDLLDSRIRIYVFKISYLLIGQRDFNGFVLSQVDYFVSVYEFDGY